MSYCIGSRIEGLKHEYVDLFPGNSIHTIEAMANSGFDAREIFRDYMIRHDLEDIMSLWMTNWPETEPEEDTPLDVDIVLEAYHHAIAWGLALQKNFPDQVEEALGTFGERPEEHLEREEIDPQRVEKLMEQKISYQKNMDEDGINRAIRFISRPLYYCSTVLPHIKQGKEVYIFYSP